MKKNTHLEHPEDSIFGGKEDFMEMLRSLRCEDSTVSVKYDGAPAIVWGIDPQNKRFFVGTKSVFNKVKIKINYTHDDIEKNHGDRPRVASILHLCMDSLPRLEGIYQGDFIGFGGTKEYTPNILTYKFFDTIAPESIVFAAHTHYVGNTIKDAEVRFSFPYDVSPPEVNANRKKGKPFDQDKVRFLNTNIKIAGRHRRINYLISLAGAAANFVKFPEGKETKDLKVAVNKCIREQKDIADAGMTRMQTYLYKIVMHIKELLLDDMIAEEQCDCYFQGEKCDHEGSVMSNRYGTFKLVNRREFSYRNFTAQKSW
jgi:hypothetical protein